MCVQTSSEDLSDKPGWATGWGANVTGGPLSRYKMQVEMKILTEARCTQKFADDIDGLRHLCAGEVGENKDSCGVIL